MIAIFGCFAIDDFHPHLTTVTLLGRMDFDFGSKVLEAMVKRIFALAKETASGWPRKRKIEVARSPWLRRN
jgi:ribosome-associated toxin RatA of RatAB toxin-antitoxin module